MTNATPPISRSCQALIWQTLLVFLLALLVRFIGMSSNPVHVDELYHLLAGRSWAEMGTLNMLDGEYLRGRGFTMLVGSLFELTGRSDLFVARLPSIVAGALLVSAIFHWLHRQAGARAAWLGALLFGFASYAILYTQFTRFYALQALLVWLGSVSVYRAADTVSFRRRLWLSIAAVVLFLAAIHLQVTTVIALLALGVWLATDLWSRALVRQRLANVWTDPRRRWPVISGLLLVLAIALYFSTSLLHQFRYTPRWAVPDQDNVLYYFLEFFFSMPILWLFLPIAGLIALTAWPRAAWFCIVMTVIPLVLQSFGGMKSSRYVFYAMPFLFALWAMAGAVLLPAVWRTIEQGVTGLQQALGGRLPGPVARGMAAGVMGLTLLMAVIANPIYRDTIKSLLRDAKSIAAEPASLISAPPDPPWTDALVEIRSRIGHPSVLLVGDDFHAIAYLGGFDLLINTHRTEDIVPMGEFVLDPRTGRRAIAQPASIAQVIGCYPDGAILVSDERWRTYIGVSDQAADAIERLTQPVHPAIPGFHLFEWHGNQPQQGCETIRERVTGHRQRS